MIKLLITIFSLVLAITSLGQVVNSRTSNLCEKPILSDKFPSFSNIPQYFDYKQAVKCQNNSKKNLLIYFTAIFSVNSRNIEKEVLSDTSVIRLLDKFIIVTLYVDDKKVGKINFEIQEKKYKGSYQPQFVIQPYKGDWKSLNGYVTRETFINFLRP